MHSFRFAIVLSLALLLAGAPAGSAASLRLPAAGTPLRLPAPAQSSSSAAASSVETAASVASAGKALKVKNVKPQKKSALAEYCAAVASVLAQGEKMKPSAPTNKQRVDQTVDLLKKADALCGTMDFAAESGTQGASSACAPDGFMGVKGTCNDKSWSTGGVCMPKSYWEGQVQQSCAAPMKNVSYEKPCVTSNNACAAESAVTASSSASACNAKGFMGAKLTCAGKPMSTGGVCMPKSYWESWAKQSCTSFTGFEVQAPCEAACSK